MFPTVFLDALIQKIQSNNPAKIVVLSCLKTIHYKKDFKLLYKLPLVME